MRYWGVTQAEYYARADVWPLAPQGEILVVDQIEDPAGIANLDDMLKNVPGIGVVLIGEGDLSQELGYPRQYEHPEVLDAMAEIVETCKKHKVVVGHPHVDGGECRARHRRGLPLPDVLGAAQLRDAGQGPRARRTQVTSGAAPRFVDSPAAGFVQ